MEKQIIKIVNILRKKSKSTKIVDDGQFTSDSEPLRQQRRYIEHGEGLFSKAIFDFRFTKFQYNLELESPSFRAAVGWLFIFRSPIRGWSPAGRWFPRFGPFLYLTPNLTVKGQRT